MGFSLDYLADDITTQETNTTGVMSNILVFDPNSGTKLVLSNRVSTGAEAGVPIYAKLRSGANTLLPINTEFELRKREPGENEFSAISDRLNNIRQFNQKTITEQQSEEQIDSQKLELNHEVVEIEDNDELAVGVKASAQISWSDSELFIDESAVEERRE